MREAKEHVRFLRGLALGLRREQEIMLPQIEMALNGQSSIEIGRLVPQTKLYKAGAYFTSSRLATKALSNLDPVIDDSSVLVDPACGLGDLLLHAANYLPWGETFKETLDIWGPRVYATDLYSEFVQICKMRLLLKAAAHHHEGVSWFQLIDPRILPNLKIGSIFDNPVGLSKATHILINPPFVFTDSPKNCTWASGKVNAAALFMEQCLTYCQGNTSIIAILPDVLRSGSRYNKWRDLVKNHASIKSLTSYGVFDEHTDIEVFILRLLKDDKNSGNWGWPQKRRIKTLRDEYNVFTGPVVDYRDPEVGPWRKFLTSRNLPTWKTVREIHSSRRFKGRTFRPPFVVVRRTSKRGENFRAVATIVRGNYNVAVENHLIVLQPKDGRVKSCERLVGILKSKKANNWLNQRIRCRHLTVESLRNIPI